MKVLSLFDGMACGMIAAKNAGLQIDSYDAYEIDKYAIQSATYNFPEIKEHGDVFEADFSKYTNIDFMWGGSPCTYWSIAQSNNRETTASGIGWELFSQYVRALKEVKPKYFIYENNKSMSKAIRDSIRETFGFEEICINSALVSAQNRNRFYWVGKYNPETDWYDKVDVEQPEDREILLKNILDNGVAWQDKSFAYTTKCQGAVIGDTLKRHRHTMVAEPVDIEEIQNETSYTHSCSWSDGGEPIKAISDTDGKIHEVYKVVNGLIYVKENCYKIGLADGYYIIRKLTVNEAKRLQTVPDWYEFPVSNTQAMKQLGNGWTCDVITHLIKSCLEDKT